jgi:branched-chain amino acid aminotransferase
MDEHFFIYNGKIFTSGEPVIQIENRALRFGDGLFETMRMQNGNLLLAEYHFDRLFKGLHLLQFEIPAFFTNSFILDKINELAGINNCLQNGRIRLMVSRSAGNIAATAEHPDYIIEGYPLNEEIHLNEKGLATAVFPDAKKSCDSFSNLKSNNYLRPLMAISFAKKNNIDEAILLNAYNHICESAIANIFMIKDNTVFTPPLTEGCVEGTIRRFLLEKKEIDSLRIEEKILLKEDLLTADELFFTNSIQPVRWVKRFAEKEYGNEKVKEIFEFINSNIYTGKGSSSTNNSLSE